MKRTVKLAVQTGIFGDGMFGDRPERDLPGVLDEVREAGYDGIEVMGNLLGNPAALRDGCRDRGLTVFGLHLFWWELDFPRLGETALELGAERLIISCLPVTGPEDIAEVADRLRALAASLAPYELPVLLHNHTQEGRVLSDGRTTLEALAEVLSPDELGFVIDVYWAAVSGTLARTLERVGPRCDYFHFKDGSLSDPKSTVPYDLGTGDVDLPLAWAAIRGGPLKVITVERGPAPLDQHVSLRRDAGYVGDLLADLTTEA